MSDEMRMLLLTIKENDCDNMRMVGATRLLREAELEGYVERRSSMSTSNTERKRPVSLTARGREELDYQRMRAGT